MGRFIKLDGKLTFLLRLLGAFRCTTSSSGLYLMWIVHFTSQLFSDAGF